MNRKDIILKDIEEILNKDPNTRLGRDKYLKESKIGVTRSEIEDEFGSWTEAVNLAGGKPLKSQNNIPDESLFEEYEKVVKLVGFYPQGHPGEDILTENSKYGGSTYKKRFGGMRNFMYEYLSWKENPSESTDEPSKDKEEVTPFKKESKLVRTQEEATQNFSKRKYYGIGAEKLVAAELLFRGYNAEILPADEGLDVFAARDFKPFFIQVKHSYYKGNPNRSGVIKITNSSFASNQFSNVYYILVLSRKGLKTRDFLILPYFKVNELLNSGAIKQRSESKVFTFSILHTKDNDAFINEISESTDVSSYLNSWNSIV